MVCQKGSAAHAHEHSTQGDVKTGKQKKIKTLFKPHA
jgi:hypothetical protein